MSDVKTKIEMVKPKYPKLNPTQKAEVAKGVDAQALMAGVVKRQKSVLQWVRDKYTQDAKPLFYDKG